METKITFEEYLRKENLSENTITSYLWTVNYFNANYDVVSKENLLAYKGYLMEFFKPKTVNLRIQAINKYLEYLEEQHLQLKAVKVQQKNFLENVISNADYNFLKKQLKKDSNMEWYFVVWYLAATGARVSIGMMCNICIPAWQRNYLFYGVDQSVNIGIIPFGQCVVVNIKIFSILFSIFFAKVI